MRLGAHLLPQMRGRHDGLHHIAQARRGCHHKTEIGGCLGDRVEHGAIVDQTFRPGGSFSRALHLPVRARTHKTQIRQAEIQHGAGDRADILAQLRANENDCRRLNFGHILFHTPSIIQR